MATPPLLPCSFPSSLPNTPTNTRSQAIAHNRLFEQAGSARLIPIGPQSDVIISFNPAAPGNYCVFDRATLLTTEHAFLDDLKLDFATMTPTLDPDGVSYNCA